MKADLHISPEPVRRPGGHYVGKHVLFHSFDFPVLTAAAQGTSDVAEPLVAPVSNIQETSMRSKQFSSGAFFFFR